MTVVEVSHWDRRFGLLPKGGHGTLRVVCEEREGRPGFPRLKAGVFALSQTEFEEHFEPIYDPHTGWEVGSYRV